MKVTVTVTVPEHIYRFYADASHCIHGRTPEDVIADALTAYAGMLSGEIARQSQTFSEVKDIPDS